jgi:hypothetical protein
MERIFVMLIFTISVSFGIENYPYLTKPVPKPKKEELPLTPKIQERDFNDKMDAYDRCKRQGKSDTQCSEFLGRQYDLRFEYKAQ